MAVDDNDSGESAFDALPDPGPQPGDEPGSEEHRERDEPLEPTREDIPVTDDGWPYTNQTPRDPPPPISLPERDGDDGDDRTEDDERPRDEMGFFDHLQELRSRIIKALLGLVAGAIIAGVNINFIMVEILLRPSRQVGVKLQNMNPMGQVTLTLQVALISGLIIAIPWIIWQFWQFVKPGLYEKEQKYSAWIAVATIVCFLTGVAFAYFVMIPTSLGFAASGFNYEGIENRWSISEYFSFVMGFILACGVVFEMPMLSFALSRFGILTPAFMRHYRRHSAVVILIVAAIITPTPDPFNQLVLAVPLYALFEISILVAALASRKREEAYAEMFSEDDVVNTHKNE